MKSEDVTEDVGHLDRLEETAVTNDDDVTEAGRRGVFPDLHQNMQSTQFGENLFQWSQEGHPSTPELIPDDLRTFPREQSSEQEPEAAK